MATHHATIGEMTLIAGLFRYQGWHYYVGPKITPSSSQSFSSKEEAAAALQREIESILAALAPQWEITVERKEW